MGGGAGNKGNGRSRAALLALIVLVIVAGLASRRFAFVVPKFLGKYPGDSLWALMVYLGWSFLRPRSPPWVLAIYAFGTSCLVEISQLYQAPWLNELRATAAGHLVLGSAFSWWDISAYAIGVGLGVALDRLLFHRQRFTSGAQSTDA